MPSSQPLRADRLHHHAYVSRDLEATRAFYEDVLHLPLVAVWAEREEVAGVEREFCHAFFELTDGSALAFFQFADPAIAAELRPPSLNPFIHVALRVDEETRREYHTRLTESGYPAYTIDHGYVVSLYTVDPDGLLVEFTVDAPEAIASASERRLTARSDLDRWLSGDRTTNNRLR